jgi:hypothetical protein
MPVVDRRVERLPLLKHAILNAHSDAEGKALQAEFDAICMEHRSFFRALSELAFSTNAWRIESQLFPASRCAASPQA